jgi:hypothetical protein
MDTDPELHPLFRQEIGVTGLDAALNFESAARGVDHTGELDQDAVAGGVKHPPAVGRNHWIEHLRAKHTHATGRPFLVGSGKAGIADDVGHQDRGQFPGLAHGAKLL